MVAKLIRLPRVPLVWVALCAGPLLGFAHEGPQHVVDEVTALITDEGETTERLVRRAQSYQRMGQLQAAQQDLARALVLSPRDRPAGLALVQVLLACDEPEQAQTLAESMLAVSAHGADAAFLYAAVGDACAQMDRLAEAADAYRVASQKHPGELDWYLKRSDVLARLGRHQDRVAALQDGRRVLTSVVLAQEWIEALIDTGDPHSAQLALASLAPYLDRARLKSSWRLQRARALRLLNQPAAAEAELSTALEELRLRIAPSKPDALLLADRAFVLILLGRGEEAEADLDQAAACGLRGWRMVRLRTLMAQHEAEMAR